MIGAYAVGKTSLVARFVRSMFSEDYHTTVGVKIDQKELTVGGQTVKLVLWDMHGEDEFQSLRRSYLRGAAGALLVADGTRPQTIEQALALREVLREELGNDIPCLLLLNKSDLQERWDLPAEREAELAEQLPVLRTSAKSGDGVEAAFLALAERMLGVSDGPADSDR